MGYFSFEFTEVPRQDLLVRFKGKDLDPDQYELLAADPGQDLRIVLGAMCRFRFEDRSGLVTAASLRMLDAREQPLSMTREITPGHTTQTSWFAIENGRSPELLVSDAAAWLVVEADGRVLVRRSIGLVRGTMNVLRD